LVTDRDLVIRGLAQGKGSSTPVRELMSPSPTTVQENDDVEVVERLMATQQIRRVPVIDASGHPVGLVAQADLARARRVSSKELGKVVESISSRRSWCTGSSHPTLPT